MPGKGFTFKQFHVQQDGAAMKVTTDACVFGAWIPGPLEGRILDAGTGTGLLALMLAQRFPEVDITGVELEEEAYHDAEINFRNAPFANRLQVVHADVLAFSDELRFDAIVCNPPFFLHALPAGNRPRNLARHLSADFSVEGFLDAANRLIRSGGRLFLLLPPLEAGLWLEKAAEIGWMPLQICRLQHDATREPHRWMIALQQLGKGAKPICTETLLQIYDQDVYSASIRTLLSPFYLHLD